MVAYFLDTKTYLIKSILVRPDARQNFDADRDADIYSNRIPIK